MPQQSTRLRRTAGIALAVTLAATALSGCNLIAGEKTLPAPQLKSELVTAPAGSKPYDRGTLAPGGILTLGQYVDGEYEAKDQATERGIMGSRGLKYAVQTNWSAQDGTQADVFLLQFNGSGGAQDYVSAASEAKSEDEKPAEPLSAVPGVPDGEAWTSGVIDDLGFINSTVWFSVGNVAVAVHYYTPATADPVGLDQLAQAQYARLTGNVTAPSPLPSPTRSAPVPAASGPASAAAADQSRLLGDLVPPPGGSKPWEPSTENGPTGVLTLPQFVGVFDDSAHQPKDTAEETQRGFQYAVRENWNGSDGSSASILLLQFAAATGAQSFTLDYQSGAGDAVGSAGTFAVPGSGDAQAFEHDKLDGQGEIWTEGFAVVGNVAVDFNFWEPGKADRAAATALFQQQYAKLLADPTVAAAAKAAPALPTPTP